MGVYFNLNLISVYTRLCINCRKAIWQQESEHPTAHVPICVNRISCFVQICILYKNKKKQKYTDVLKIYSLQHMGKCTCVNNK